MGSDPIHFHLAQQGDADHRGFGCVEWIVARGRFGRARVHKHLNKETAPPELAELFQNLNVSGFIEQAWRMLKDQYQDLLLPS